MQNLEIYRKLKGVKTEQDVVEYFLSTLLLTNRRWSFYVNWEKVLQLVDKYKVELGILEAVLDSSKQEFFETLKKYPEVIKVFPRLLAVREDKFSVLEDPAKLSFLDYDFTKPPQSDEDITKVVKFWEESGLHAALRDVKNLRDYFFGVEVGSDTNARKNRGGTEWETLVEPLIMRIAKKNGYNVEVRQQFEKVMKKLGFNVQQSLSRNMDFIVYKGNKFVDIEANYFSGAGTKLEVPGAYVNRASSKDGFTLSLFLLTDGFGWKAAKHRMEDYFDTLPCVTNYQMGKEGVLEAALKKYLD